MFSAAVYTRVWRIIMDSFAQIPEADLAERNNFLSGKVKKPLWALRSQFALSPQVLPAPSCVSSAAYVRVIKKWKYLQCFSEMSPNPSVMRQNFCLCFEYRSGGLAKRKGCEGQLKQDRCLSFIFICYWLKSNPIRPVPLWVFAEKKHFSLLRFHKLSVQLKIETSGFETFGCPRPQEGWLRDLVSDALSCLVRLFL